MAAGDADAGDCWCGEERISPAALARVAPNRRGQACLCRRCGTDAPDSWPSLASIVQARLARIRHDH